MRLLRLHRFFSVLLMTCAVMSSQALNLDDKTLIKLIDHGSTKLAKLKQEHDEIQGDKEQRDYVKELNKDINEEKRRCQKYESAIRALAPKVKKSGKIDLQDEQGRTLLMLVAALGNDAATQMVLREAPDLMITDKKGNGVMAYEKMGDGTTISDLLKDRWKAAFAARNQDEIFILLDCGAGADWPIDGEPPLGLAIKEGNNTLFDRLMMYGAHAGNRMSDGTPLIELAVEHCNDNAVADLLNALNETEIIFTDGAPIFRKLMSAKHAECLSAWFNKAQSLKKMNTADGTSYFCLIMRLAETSSAKKIAARHVDLLNQEDAEGNLPLHEAARRGDAELYKELVKLGASPATRNSRGETALMHAALSEDEETLAAVLEGISPDQLNATDKDGHTAHYYAKLAKDQAATNALKAAGLQPQKKD